MSENHNKVFKILREQLALEDGPIAPSARLIADLVADSLDLIEVVMALEEEFDFEIPDVVAEKFDTVQDILDYIDKNFPLPASQVGLINR